MPICPHVCGCFHSAAQPPVVTEIIGLEKPKIFVIRVFTEKKKNLLSPSLENVCKNVWMFGVAAETALGLLLAFIWHGDYTA